MLERSKTTGPGKRAGELFIFIARAAGFSGVDWMAAGMELLRGEELSFDRDYLIPLMRYEEGGHIGVRKKIAPYSAAAGYGRAVLRQLHDVRLGLEAWEETDAFMFSIEGANFWSEHSERHFLPQALSALEVQKNLRDKVGRWAAAQAHQSDDYILTQRKLIQGLQKKVLYELSGMTERYDESDIWEGYVAYLKDLNISEPLAHEAADRIVLAKVEQKFGLNQEWPLCIWPSLQGESRLRRSEAMVTLQELEDKVKDEDEHQHLEEEEVSGLRPGTKWFSISDRGHRRLHVAGATRCFVSTSTCRKWSKLEEDTIKVSSFCKFCFPSALEVTESTSGSSSTELGWESPASEP